MKIKIFIVDDHSIIRMGLRKLIETENDMEICGEAGTVNEAIDQIAKTKPDVLIADIAFEDEMSGIDLVKAVNSRYPGIVILIHSMFKEALYAERALRAGAMGYIQKNEAPKKIVSAVREAMNGNLVVSKNTSDKILNKILHNRQGSGKTNVDTLTDREFEIFQMFGKGYEIKKIAEILNISPHTIETHRRNIRDKMDISNNSELIRSAVEWNTSHSR